MGRAGPGRAGPGRARPGRFITDMGSIHENNFVFLNYVLKFNTKRDVRCCELPYVTVEGGSRLRAMLRFAQRRSQLCNDRPSIAEEIKRLKQIFTNNIYHLTLDDE